MCIVGSRRIWVAKFCFIWDELTSGGIVDLAAVLSSRFMQTVARSQIDLCSSCRLCSDLVGIFTLKRNAPSLRAPRAETRLTVYRALRSVAKVACAFSKNIFSKMKISRDPVDIFCWEASNLEFFACRFRFWRRDVWENSVARERALYGLAKWTKFLEKCLLVRYSSIFRALPGAHAPRRVHSPFKRIPYG